MKRISITELRACRKKPAMGVGYYHILIERIGSMCVAHCLERGFVAAALTAGAALEELRQAILQHNEYLRDNQGAVTYTSPDDKFRRFAEIAGWTGNPRAAVLQHTMNGLFGTRFRLYKPNRKWLEVSEINKLLEKRNDQDPKKYVPPEEVRIRILNGAKYGSGKSKPR